MISKKLLFEFYIFEKLLKKSMSVLNASEIHGIMIASICIKKNRENNIGNIVLDLLDIKQNKKIVLSFINHLYISNIYQITQVDKMLHLMIPDKKEDLFVKIKYLKSWIKGFISGLGLFGLNEKKYKIPIIYEIINDLSTITYAQNEKKNNNEIYYINLIEYIKVSVEIIYFEILKFKTSKIK